MGSSRQQDRSLGGGISLPQWMRAKIDNRFDLDETAFSPPSHDDSFFYIRYSKKPSLPDTAQAFKPFGQTLNENNVTASTNQVTSGQPVPDFKEVKQVDFSKHPLPCQPFVPPGANKAGDIKPPKTIVAANIKPKPQGTDDGFHSEPALCGKSIVHVANQMMSSKITKVVTSESRVEQVEGIPKKGSKSLPATPLASPITSPDSSPKSRRKIHSNRYFTGTFVPDREKFQGGWLLGSILGHSRELLTPKIDEEDESAVEITPPPKALSRKKSISSQNLTYIGKEEKTASVFANVLQPKPSELREMNFWSPTSM